ncbi:ribosomal protein L2 [Fistulina hepatica ATCC 64428]|uniref:Large ribosomal subunit protein uL2m n=1 Tax=Fistulina hepatica ATCC 64428 TaxID=1128425 RepID=A0A0D7AHA8_9AGAR|nr:ribosomal protein L2 [Fistulina hepatica ATCC 64428]
MSLSRTSQACSGFLRACKTSWRPSTTPKAFGIRHYTAPEAVSVQDALQRTESIFKKYKPVTPGIRHLKRPLNPHLYRGRPVRALTIPKRKKGGRNSTGRITVRHRGGGHKQRIRTIDFMRQTPGIHDVVRIEYDPGRSAHIALLKNRDRKVQGIAKWSYIVATEGMRAGHEVQSFRQGIPEGLVKGFGEEKEASANDNTHDAHAKSSAENLAMGLLRTLTVRPGNVLPLRLIPPGTFIHCISLKPEGPAVLVRSAGTYAIMVESEEGSRYAHVRLQSGEVRKIHMDCCATVGKVSNATWKLRSLGKAGRARWLGWRPTVRGVAMNAVDHPHGGGRGKSKSGKHPVSIWGWGTKGTRTRKPGPKGPKNSNKMVIHERPRGVEKRGGKAF